MSWGFERKQTTGWLGHTANQSARAPGRRTRVDGLIQMKRAAAPTTEKQTSSTSPLAPPVRATMEQSFGADFSTVSIHQSDDAAALGARAFTRGEEIHFAPGEYDPSSQQGRELLGHELTHVVQQRAGRVPATTTQGKGFASNHDAGLEAEADAMGALAARGERVPLAASAAPASSHAPAQFKYAWQVGEKEKLAALDTPARIDAFMKMERAARKKAMNDYYADNPPNWMEELKALGERILAENLTRTDKDSESESESDSDAEEEVASSSDEEDEEKSESATNYTFVLPFGADAVSEVLALKHIEKATYVLSPRPGWHEWEVVYTGADPLADCGGHLIACRSQDGKGFTYGNKYVGGTAHPKGTWGENDEHEVELRTDAQVQDPGGAPGAKGFAIGYRGTPEAAPMTHFVQLMWTEFIAFDDKEHGTKIDGLIGTTGGAVLLTTEDAPGPGNLVLDSGGHYYDESGEHERLASSVMMFDAPSGMRDPIAKKKAFDTPGFKYALTIGHFITYVVQGEAVRWVVELDVQHRLDHDGSTGPVITVHRNAAANAMNETHAAIWAAKGKK